MRSNFKKLKVQVLLSIEKVVTKENLVKELKGIEGLIYLFIRRKDPTC